MVFLVMFFMYACTKAQKEEFTSTNKPKVHIDVKKEYDDKGNIVRYDSTYSWFWSNVDTLNDVYLNDSLFASFMKRPRFFDFDMSFDSLFYNPFGMMNKSFVDFNFDINKEFEEFENILRQHHQMHQQIMKKFMQPPLLIPVPEEKQKQEDTRSSSKKSTVNSSERKGVDL